MSKQYAFITGASGLLGKLITKQLKLQGYVTIGLQHRKPTQCDHTVHSVAEALTITGELALVINLAGASIAGRLWTQGYQQQLRDSRILFTQKLITQLSESSIKVEHFISGSAIGYYGVGADFKNESSPAGSDFSAQLCRDWEAAAENAQALLNTRVSIIRTGLVLAPDDGFLAPLWQTNRFHMGAVFGTGTQGIAWVDYRDWLAMVAFIYQNSLSGTFNLTSPEPVTQQEFVDTLAATTTRKRWLKIPSWSFAPLGPMKTLFIEGQFIVPEALKSAGYQFKYPALEDSLRTIHGEP